MKKKKNEKKSIIFDKLRESDTSNLRVITLTELNTVPKMQTRVKLFYKCITQF